jgi:hypothetical protein
MPNWKTDNRPSKNLSREMATDFSLRKSALFLPADTAVDLLLAEQKGMISKCTKLTLVERHPQRSNTLRQIVKSSGWTNARIHPDELHNLVLTHNLDYAWIDLNGTVDFFLAQWITEELSIKLISYSVLCLTQEYCWRNNKWLKQVREYVLKNYHQEYSRFRQDNLIFSDKYLAFPAFLMQNLLGKQLRILPPLRYSDTIDMVFYRFIVMPQQISLPLLLPRRKLMTTPTCQEVINAILTAKTPAAKAAATRLLNSYVASRVKDGKSEKGVRAAVQAHVTRRQMNTVPN